MELYKLQILVPQYKEDEAVIKYLLDSISMQQGIDFEKIGVIICNDGSDVYLSDDFLSSYPYRIEYYKESHRGVSATRNSCLQKAKAEYVMFCDADDMFLSALGLWTIFREMTNGFDVLNSDFLQEIKDPVSGTSLFELHSMDGIFIHGKVYRRKYLTDNRILFDENLTINEDSYFVSLCHGLTKNVLHIRDPFYLWKYRYDSVSHNDPKYEFKAYCFMFDSNEALIEEFLRRKVTDQAKIYTAQMLLDAYYTLTDPEWALPENRTLYLNAKMRFLKWLRKYELLWRAIPFEDKIYIMCQLMEGIDERRAGRELSGIEDWLTEIKTYIVTNIF